MNLKGLVSELFNNEIARRYLTKNMFDGVLTIFGVLIALYSAGVTSTRVIIISCIGSGIAMSVSGWWGAYVTEAAERKLKAKKLEKHLLRNLEGTIIMAQGRRAAYLVSIVDGGAPLIVTLLVIIPFLLTPLITLGWAFYSSFIILVLIVVVLGVLIARVNHENLLINILKMLVAGALVAALIFFIESLRIG